MKYRKDILVTMDYIKHTEQIHETVLVDYDKDYEPASYNMTTEEWSFDPGFAYKEGWSAIADEYYEASSGNYLLFSADPEASNQDIYYLYSETTIQEVANPFYSSSSTKAIKVIKGTVIFV